MNRRHKFWQKNVKRKVFTRALAIINHDVYVFREIPHMLWSSVDFVWNVLLVEFIYRLINSLFLFLEKNQFKL